MPEAQDNPQSSPARVASSSGINWKAAWPIVLLTTSAALLIGGIVTGFMWRPTPDPADPLRQAHALVADQHYQEAIEVLNTKMLPFLDEGLATAEQQADFYRTRAEAFYYAQSVLGISREENHQQIVDDYQFAQDLGHELNPADMMRLAKAHLALGNVDQSYALVKKLPENQVDRRRALIRDIVEHNLKSKDVRFELTLDLINMLLNDPRINEDDRVWGLARQAELLLEEKRYEEAISKILRDIQRLEDVESEAEGELHMLLGRAYYEVGQLQEAFQQLQVADELLSQFNELRGQANVYLGRILQTEGRLDDARDKYLSVIGDFGNTRAYLPALVGLAEAYAGLNLHEESLGTYSKVVDELSRVGKHRDVTRHTVTVSLLNRFSERYNSDDTRTALRYAQIADSVYPDQDVPAEVHRALGIAHRTIADEMLIEAGASSDDPMALAQIDPVTRYEIRRHYVYAGDNFMDLSRDVIVQDNTEYLNAVWNAADAFDRAGDRKSAQEAFSTYLAGSTEGDPRKPQAQFRLAQTFQAMGDYPTAESYYEDLIDKKRASQPEKGVGLWADRSVVPLAQSYLLDEDPTNDSEAEHLLKTLLKGEALSPEALEYRDALIQLGRMYYETGRYVEASEQLLVAIKEYPDYRRIEALKFWLADSYRLSARQIESDLKEQARPRTIEEQWQQARRERLTKAIQLYDEVRDMIEKIDPKDRTAPQKVYLRNTHFYAGDCAYDLGQYDRAIQYYDAARQKYSKDPSSLVAMVQIINAYIEQDMWEEAATAQERARQHYKRLNEEYGSDIWDSPTLPMERKHWERWLDSRILLDQKAHAQSKTGLNG